jgi:hypothetical protein
MKQKIEKACVTLIDTYNNEGLTYEDYVNDCKECDIEPESEASIAFSEWLGEMTSNHTEDFFDNMEWTKVDYPVMITGELGLWNGRPSIVPVKMESTDFVTYYTNWKGERIAYDRGHFKKPSLLRAIQKCISGNSILDFKVRFNDGVIEVDAMHHDGTNRFYIRKLSVKGLMRAKSFENRYEDYEPKDYWFSRIKYDEIF